MIDIHSHLYPRSYLRLLSNRSDIPRLIGEPGSERIVSFRMGGGKKPDGNPITEAFWSIDAKLAFMDEHGIDQAVVSLGNPWLDPFDGLDSPEIARKVNGEFASLEEQTGRRLLGAGVLPSDSISSTVEATWAIADTPTLYAIAGGSRIAGHLLDDPELEPIWDAVEVSGLPYFLHPKGEMAIGDLGGYAAFLPTAVGFPMETTVALARLVSGLVLQRHPNLRIIAAHGGGVIPYLAGRLDKGWETDPTLCEELPTPPSVSLAEIYLDTLVYRAPALRLARGLVGPDHLMFGTDHPWYSTFGDPLNQTFAGDELHLVRQGTARRLLRLPQRRAATFHSDQDPWVGVSTGNRRSDSRSDGSDAEEVLGQRDEA